MNTAISDGVIVVDKPEGWTSHDVVAKMRRLAATRRIGHLGTLDPAATGVLPLLIGRVTRLAQFYLKAEKVYDAVVRFGFSTDTYDRDGEPTSEVTHPVLDAVLIESHLDAFRGAILQVPPPVSAKKVGGVPAYKLARKNIAVELAPVEVNIAELRLVECAGETARLLVRCSAGTYVRGLAHDLGNALGCGAHLGWLRRVRTGHFDIAQAHTMEELVSLAAEGRLGEVLVPAACLLPEWPAETVDSVTAAFIRQGRDFRTSPFRVPPGTPFVKALDTDGALLAIGEARLPNLYHPVIVL